LNPMWTTPSMERTVLPTAVRTTRRYDPNRDMKWIHSLWQRTMHRRWSITPVELHRVLAGATLGLITEQAGTPIGFCAVGYRDHGPAGIIGVLVEPAYQRQEVGTNLLKQVEQILLDIGIARLNVGFGNDSNYFWPGVPSGAYAARSFFESLGWAEDDVSFDLVQDLREYQTPFWIYTRLAAARIVLRLASPQLRNKIVCFEQRWFPAWTEFYRNALAASEYENILLALDGEGSIVGAVLLRSEDPARWEADRGVGYGTINVLGVADDYQGRGIGIALAARAMEILRDRQCDKCYIQWTGLIDWYGKLGAKVWAEYRMSSKALIYQREPAQPLSSGCHVLP
jgi:GNAT superfamily N-acetyltransferase